MNLEDFKEIYRKYKFIFWPVLVGLSSVAVISLVIIPQFLNYLSGKDKINEAKSRYMILDAKARELEEVDEAAVKKYLQLALTVLPEDHNIPESVTIVKGITEKSGVILKNIDYVNASKAESKSSFQLTLTVMGSLDSIKRFLSNLSTSERLFQIESIGIRFNRLSSQVEAEIPVSVFYEGVARGAVSLDQSVPKLTEEEKKLLANLSTFVPLSTVATTPVSESTPSNIDLVYSGLEDNVSLGKDNPFE